MRRSLLLVVACAAVFAPALAFAQPSQAPAIDVVELAGLIDRPLVRYALQRLDDAEAKGRALIVFQIDSVGASKISDDEALPPIVRRIRDARIPVGVFIGPRGARAGGVAAYMAAAAHVSGVGPSVRFGPAFPIDVAVPKRGESDALAELTRVRGRAITGEYAHVVGANEAARAGFVDVVAGGLSDFFRRIDGRTVTTASGTVLLRLPERETTVRFFQPGPIRRLVHAFANPGLAYLCLVAGILLIVFEIFQPGFGVAGVTGGLLLVGAAYGLTVLPASLAAIGAILISAGLLAYDVARDEVLVPTVAGTAGLVVGSLILLPRGSPAVRLSNWVLGLTIAACVIFFVPVMTYVARARRTVDPAVRRALVGEDGEVRSVLNPEGFVVVMGDLWRARSEDGERLRVGQPVQVSSVEGTLLIVRPGTSEGVPASDM